LFSFVELIRSGRDDEVESWWSWGLVGLYKSLSLLIKFEVYNSYVWR
jgi:hypothetical protein